MKLNDPSTSEVSQDNSENLSPFLPIILFGLAALIFIGVGMKNEIARRSTLTIAIQQRQQPVAQSKQIRTQLDKIATDILSIADSDAEARNIVTKFRIQAANPGQKTSQ